MTGKIKTSAVAGTPYAVDFELESANGPTVIAAQTLIIKGGNHVNHFSLSAPFYAGSFINGYDLEIYLTADQNISLYDVGFILVRHYVES